MKEHIHLSMFIVSIGNEMSNAKQNCNSGPVPYESMLFLPNKISDSKISRAFEKLLVMVVGRKCSVWFPYVGTIRNDLRTLGKITCREERLKRKVRGDAKTEAQSSRRKGGVLSEHIVNLCFILFKASSISSTEN